MIDWIKSSGWPFASVGGFGVGALTMAIAMEGKTLSAGDVLGFAGAMIGVAAAVGGAIYIESWKEGERRAADRKLLVDAIEQVRFARRYAASPAADTKAVLMELRLRYGLLRSAHDELSFALDRVLIDDMSVWRSVRHILTILSSRLAIIEPALTKLLTEPTPQELIASWVTELADYLVNIDNALNELSGTLRIR